MLGNLIAEPAQFTQDCQFARRQILASTEPPPGGAIRFFARKFDFAGACEILPRQLQASLSFKLFLQDVAQLKEIVSIKPGIIDL